MFDTTNETPYYLGLNARALKTISEDIFSIFKYDSTVFEVYTFPTVKSLNADNPTHFQVLTLSVNLSKHTLVLVGRLYYKNYYTEVHLPIGKVLDMSVLTNKIATDIYWLSLLYRDMHYSFSLIKRKFSGYWSSSYKPSPLIVANKKPYVTYVLSDESQERLSTITASYLSPEFTPNEDFSFRLRVTSATCNQFRLSQVGLNVNHILCHEHKVLLKVGFDIGWEALDTLSDFPVNVSSFLSVVKPDACLPPHGLVHFGENTKLPITVNEEQDLHRELLGLKLHFNLLEET